VQTIRRLATLIPCALAAALALAAPAAQSNHATATQSDPGVFTCRSATGETQAGERLTVKANCFVEGGTGYRYHVESKPRHGYLKLNRDGSGIWQENPAYTGDDEFTYWATAKTPAGQVKSSTGSLQVSFTRRNPPLKTPQFTISRAAGSPRVKVGGRWQPLTRPRSFTHPVVVDTLPRATRSRIKLTARHGLDSSGNDALSSGTFDGAMLKIDHGPAQGAIAARYYAFNKVSLTGPPDCGGPGRDVDVVVRHGSFTVKNARFSVTALAPSSFDSGDIGCMGISNVAVDYGRVTIPGGKVLHKNESYSEPVEND
jgi:hypothetical protein